jgi:hypothetical protein
MNTAEPSPDTEDDPLIQLCSACGVAIDISEEEPLAQITCPACGAEETVSGIVDKFELQEIVGRGGMGVVYKAYDSGLDRYVALKLMRSDKANRSVVEQLEKEASITASINHPHVVRVFTSGTDHGRFFIAMELVDKGTLDDLIHLQGRVAETQVLEVGIQIAQGLRAALQAGLIHRDVKPGNILFADAHTAKIVDFGLAIFQADEESQRGEVWGTPYYVAPEKLDHKPEDFRSDMYSLGGTLFHALAGRPPFEADDASMVALKHLKSQVVSLQAFAPHVSSETAYVINRTLVKDPNDRYQSYDELIEHLGYALEKLQAQGGQPVQKRRVVLEDEAQQKAMGWITAVMFGLILLLGVSLFVFRKEIFKSAQAAGASPSPAQAGVVAAKTGPSAEARQKLLEGDTAGAIAFYREQGANPKVPPLQQAWANFGEGIAQLIAGQPDAAKAAFSAVVARPQFKSKGDDEKVDIFLRDLAKEMAAPGPIRATAAAGLNAKSYEAFAIFAYGVKDWAQAKSEDAGNLLRQFRRTEPAGAYAWIGEYKLLATKLLEEQAAFEMAADQLKAAKGPEQHANALAALKKLKWPFAALVPELERSVPPPARRVALPKFDQWTTIELGAPDQIPSAARDAAGVFTIKSGGAGFWNNSDSGLFIHQPMEGDCEIVARVVSVSRADASSKAGVMLRENPKPDSRNVALLISPDGGVSGIHQQLRAKPGNATIEVKAEGGMPRWLKLVRKGDTITGSHSTDGQTWKEITSQKLEKLPAKVFVGLAVSANSTSAATTAKIDQAKAGPAQ